ncbi:M28 family metallopeptidase [Prosthecobacter sp.]|uniref:M28 family metallopeptidase n=1 Tax=Prosthecobacter sp. TaxID=1965333 RepID=UPI003784E06A
MNPLAAQLRQDTEAICYADGRKVGTPGHERARLHLLRRLEEIGCLPFAGDSLELPYHHRKQDFCNLVGRIPGQDSRLPPLLIGAHYDSVIPFPCADDNAAAVAIALQAGRMIRDKGGLRRDVVIAIFDAEEPPYFLGDAMGSQRFYADHVAGKVAIHAAVVMDLVGHDISVPGEMLGIIPGVGLLNLLLPGFGRKDFAVPHLRSGLFVTGSESHAELPPVLQSFGQPPDLRVIATQNCYIGDVSDHGVFRRNGVPYWFLSCGQWAHYHTPTDTPDRLNYDKMAAVTNYLVQMVEGLDGRELRGERKTEQITETIELEAEFLRSALGILHRPVMRWAGLKDVKTREDMDQFARALLGMGLGVL